MLLVMHPKLLKQTILLWFVLITTTLTIKLMKLMKWIFSFQGDCSRGPKKSLPNLYIASMYDGRCFFFYSKKYFRWRVKYWFVFHASTWSFYWPQREHNSCYTPYDNIFCTVCGPQTSSMDRTYYFMSKDTTSRTKIFKFCKLKI